METRLNPKRRAMKMKSLSNNQHSKVLIVEDEAKIARFLELELVHEGYAVRIAGDGRSGLEAVSAFQPDLLILDLMLPGLSGIEVCRRIRAQEADSRLPILMLTAKDDISDKVMGLDMGADDYMTKPFAIEELLARLRALLKRGAPRHADEGEEIRRGLLCLNAGSREAWYDRQPLKLTRTEFDLLECLMRNAGLAMTRDKLLESVWGWNFGGDANVVDVYIRYLRQKIDERFGVSLIHTVRGIGYLFKDEAHE